MKQILSIIVAVLTMIATSCSNEQMPSLPKEEAPATVKGKVRTADEAIAIAMSAKGKLNGHKSRASYTVKDINCYGSPATRSNVGADSLYYIINFDDNEGYAIVGADRRVSDVLVVADEGDFDVNDIEPNTPRELMYEFIQNYALTQSLEPAIEIIEPTPLERWEVYCDTMVMHNERMLNTRWKQSGIYAKYAGSLYNPPRDASSSNIGCAPLAMGMVMSYFHAPQTIKITFDGSNRLIQPNWPAMLRYDTIEDRYNLRIDEERDAAKEDIALVLREIAEQAGSHGYADGSVGTAPSAIPYTMRYFGYTCTTTSWDNTENVPLPSIQDNKMIICCSWGSVGGHAMVFDGYQQLHIQKGERVWRQSGTIWYIAEELNTEIYDSSLVHVNWGWGGTDNGFYEARMFLQSSYRELDKYSTGSTLPFTFDSFLFFTITR